MDANTESKVTVGMVNAESGVNMVAGTDLKLVVDMSGDVGAVAGTKAVVEMGMMAVVETEICAGVGTVVSACAVMSTDLVPAGVQHVTVGSETETMMVVDPKSETILTVLVTMQQWWQRHKQVWVWNQLCQCVQ